MTPAHLDQEAEQAALEKRFRELEAIWRRETGVLSATPKIVNHPAFRAIIAMGWPVVPLLLRDLEKQPRLWVWALPEITGENPIPEDAGGNIARMSELWVQWGRERGLSW